MAESLHNNQNAIIRIKSKSLKQLRENRTIETINSIKNKLEQNMKNPFVQYKV